jgi:hypothetical protein
MNKNEQVKGMANLNRGSVGVQEAQPAPVKVWEAEGYDALMQEMQMVKARNIRQHAEIERLKAAQPAVPDAFGTREGEHPQYVQGWNDCRAETLNMRKP